MLAHRASGRKEKNAKNVSPVLQKSIEYAIGNQQNTAQAGVSMLSNLKHVCAVVAVHKSCQAIAASLACRRHRNATQPGCKKR
jgi:hypothetical protein